MVNLYIDLITQGLWTLDKVIKPFYDETVSKLDELGYFDAHPEQRPSSLSSKE